MPDEEVSPDHVAPGDDARAQRRGPWLWVTVRERWDILLMIAMGGALGTLARWGVAGVLPNEPGEIPWSTWLVNVTGAFTIGALLVLVVDVWPPSRYVRPFFAVGILGGYTTFSTYMLDTRSLVAADELARAAIYLLGTLITGLAAVFVGMVSARALVPRRYRRPWRTLPINPDVTAAELTGPLGHGIAVEGIAVEGTHPEQAP